MNSPCVWPDSFICVTWLIHMCDMTNSYVWHDSFICVTWLIHMCDMPHSYVWHDSSICVTWLIHTCDMTHSYVWHYSCIYVIWLNFSQQSNLPWHGLSLYLELYVRHDSFMRMASRFHVCDVTYVRHDSFIYVTWWLVHICDIILQVSFAKEPYKRYDILSSAMSVQS